MKYGAITFQVREAGSDDDWKTVQADYYEHAAELYAELVYADWEYPNSMELEVKDPQGKISFWGIAIEHEPVFYASERKKGQP